VTVDIVLTNTGDGVTGSDFEVGSFNFAVTTNQLILNPPVGADANLNANPNFSESGVGSVGTSWSCTPPAPTNDSDASAAVAQSELSCFESTGTGPNVAVGSSIVLATVTYTAASGSADLVISNADVGDPFGTPIVSGVASPDTAGCRDINGADACIDADVTVSGTAANTPTPTNTPAPTSTPCTGGGCPPTSTSTSLAFVTITPTPGGETATPAPGEPTTAPGGETPVAPGGGGQQPGGGTGAGGGRPITLPDTGANGGGGIDWSSFGLVGLLALVAGTIAGGTYYYAARRVTAGRDE
jgi:hypothetical protein